MSTNDKEPVTAEWLVANGFESDRFFGFIRRLSRGPGDSLLAVTVGNYPFNSPCCSILLGGFGVVTNATSRKDILVLVRLLDGAAIDHPYEMEIDLGDKNG